MKNLLNMLIKILDSKFNFFKKQHSLLMFFFDSTYSQRKFERYRYLTFFCFLVFWLASTSSWLMDYLIDQNQSFHTILARLAFAWMIFPSFAILRVKTYRKAMAITLISLMLNQSHNILIFNSLANAFHVGSGAFVYFIFAAAMVSLGFPLWFGMPCIFFSAVFPLLLNLNGWLLEFNIYLYLAFLTPGLILTTILTVVFAWDYHARYLLECELEKSSNSDPLTGISNRRHFNVMLNLEIAKSQHSSLPCALIFIDIDHFKKVNDRHGHPSGDQVICALANLCTQHSRGTDCVARLGGEELAILMPNTSFTNAAALAERLREKAQLEKVISAKGDDIWWTVSIGVVSLSPSKSDDLSYLFNFFISAADTALYEAKKLGRNQVVALDNAS